MSILFENFCVRIHFAASFAYQQHRETNKERERRDTDRQTNRQRIERESERESYINETNYLIVLFKQ